MATNTSRLALRKPDDVDAVDQELDLNANFDKIDVNMGRRVVTSATRPAGADRYTGQLIYETDTRRSLIFDGTIWTPEVDHLRISKASTTAKSTDIVLANDPDLFTDLDAGTWDIHFRYFVDGSAAGNFKVAYTFSGANGIIRRTCMGPSPLDTDSADTKMKCIGVNDLNSQGYGTDGANWSIIEEKVLIVVTAGGTFNVQWCQLASSGTTTLMNHSQMEWWRL